MHWWCSVPQTLGGIALVGSESEKNCCVARANAVLGWRNGKVERSALVGQGVSENAVVCQSQCIIGIARPQA
jgi:hypothetical protein